MNNNIIYKVTKGKYKGSIGKVIIKGPHTKECVLLTEINKEIIIVSEDDIEPI